MRRFLTLVCLLVIAVPAGISISGCYRNPAGNYCNGLGYGPKVGQLYAITLGPQYTGVSLAYSGAYGQTRQSATPSGVDCKGSAVSVTSWSYGTTNNQLVDVSTTGNICAGTWNRNSGGGIADYTICNAPNPVPSTNGLPYGVAYLTASADGVTSNPVPVYVHAQVTSISLVGPSSCLSQNQVAQLDSQACYTNSSGNQVLMCAPSSVTSGTTTPACALPANVSLSQIPTCESSIGTMTYTAGTSAIATINAETNQITAQLPGTTVITASIAGSGSSAGYFSTCPPAKISVALANGSTSGTVTQGVQQSLVTNVTDTNGNAITGLTLDYQSTNPLNLTVSSAGAITASYPGAASVYAVCQPTTCNPAPINQVGVQATGLSIASNPVDITIPGTASTYVWYGAPGQSQYFIPYDLLTGTPGSTVRLPYVPNSMMMDRTGTDLYFGSSTELMVYSAATNTISGQYTTVPGTVLAVSPTNSAVLINDQVRQVFYLFNTSGGIQATFGGLGVSAAWTPDAKTLYIVDSAAANVNGVTGHTNTLYVYNVNTGFTSYPLSSSTPADNAQALALTIPGVGAYIAGASTVAHTWCPTGTPSNYSSMLFYPQGDDVSAATDVLAATADGDHILGASLAGGGIAFDDIAVTIPSPTVCPGASSAADFSSLLTAPLTISHTLNQTTMTANATSLNQIVTSPAAVTSGTGASGYSLSFVTYNGTATNATLPYYTQTVGSGNTSLGTVGYVTLTGASSITAPIAGAFSPDNSIFFVSTSGDNKVHYINTTTLQDTQQITPNLPACTPVSQGGTDSGCTYTGTDSVVPATVIETKPRATT
jgi:trimeric autotransporter adhesin